jgi:hypothetical protein
MKTLTAICFIVISLCAVSASESVAAVLPAGQPEYDFIYDLAERTDALSRDYTDYQLGPYRFDQVSLYPGPFWRLHGIASDRIETFAFASENLRTVKDTHGTGYERFRAGFAAQPTDHLSVFGTFLLDEAAAKDPTYTGKKWRGLAGDVDQAFVSYETRRLTLIAGRFGSFWGPRNSLVISPHSKLDGFGYTYRWGRVSISYRLAQLDGLNPDEDSTGVYVNRYLAMHRFDIHLARGFYVGVFESMVFGGPGRSIDLFYLNPIMFYHGAQLNEGQDDNTLIGMDFAWKPVTGCKLYGQVLIDDFQIDKKTASDHEPDEYGVILGVHLVDRPAYNHDVKIEYTRVTNWTFNQVQPRNRYLHDGKPIGGALGNDYDLLAISATRWFATYKSGAINFRYYRQGEGRVTAAWTAPWAAAGADYSESFPTGIVEKTTTLSLGGKGFVTEHGFVDVEAGVDWVKNRNHIPTDTRALPFFHVSVSAFIGIGLPVDR